MTAEPPGIPAKSGAAFDASAAAPPSGGGAGLIVLGGTSNANHSRPGGKAS